MAHTKRGDECRRAGRRASLTMEPSPNTLRGCRDRHCLASGQSPSSSSRAGASLPRSRPTSRSTRRRWTRARPMPGGSSLPSSTPRSMRRWAAPTPTARRGSARTPALRVRETTRALPRANRAHPARPLATSLGRAAIAGASARRQPSRNRGPRSPGVIARSARFACRPTSSRRPELACANARTTPIAAKRKGTIAVACSATRPARRACAPLRIARPEGARARIVIVERGAVGRPNPVSGALVSAACVSRRQWNAVGDGPRRSPAAFGDDDRRTVQSEPASPASRSPASGSASWSPPSRLLASLPSTPASLIGRGSATPHVRVFASDGGIQWPHP